MDSFSILTNRKRALIALAHTVIFLCVAALQTALSHATAFSLHGDKVAGGVVLLMIYTIVTTVLLILLRPPVTPAKGYTSRFARPALRLGCYVSFWETRRCTPARYACSCCRAPWWWGPLSCARIPWRLWPKRSIRTSSAAGSFTNVVRDEDRRVPEGRQTGFP